MSYKIKIAILIIILFLGLTYKKGLDKSLVNYNKKPY